MKNTILGGILFLIPLAVVTIVLGKAYQVGLLVIKPLERILPIDSVGGVALVNILAVLLILALCYLAGLAARRGFLSGRMTRLDDFLVDLLPGYAVAKGMIGSARQEDDIASLLTPVLVRFDDYDQIAFELERNETEATVFLPGAPSAWSGSAVVVAVERVRKLDIPTYQAAKLMRKLGRGMLDAKA